MKSILHSLLLSGILLLVIGAYLCIVKAGLPYADPTLEMQIKYSAYYTAGTYNLFCGAIMTAASIAGLIISNHNKKEL